MKTFIGLDIGGTKIAGACYSEDGKTLSEVRTATPQDYDSFIKVCTSVVAQIRSETNSVAPVGISLAGAVKLMGEMADSANMPYLSGHFVRTDLSSAMSCPVRLANDADCMALAEAIDGAGRGSTNVLGIILGTGVGGGHVLNRRLFQGPNGLGGEVGHLSLPFYEETDGPLVLCGCGQRGCSETFISGPGLCRLHKRLTGHDATPIVIRDMAKAGDPAAIATLDKYYEMVAKFLVCTIYTFDPEIIVFAGGMNDLDGLYTQVPERVRKYLVVKNATINIKRAELGATAGLRGAARLWVES